MRIAFFVDQFPCLSETFILHQITGLIDRGHEVDIYCDRPGNTKQMHPEVEKYQLLARRYYTFIPYKITWRYVIGIPLLLLNFFRAPVLIFNSFNRAKYDRVRYGKLAERFQAFLLMLPLLNKAPYDIIQCHYGRNGLKAILLQDLGAIEGKIVTAFHGHDVSSYLQTHGERIYDYLLERADLFQPISNYWSNKLIALGCSASKIVVHHMGVDCHKFKPMTTPTNNSDKIIITSVARLVEMKGISYGIAAIAELLTQQPELKLEYRIVGDGVLRKELEQQIQKLQLEEQIQLLGWQNQEQVREIIAQTDILLAPSVVSKAGDYEGIPVCLMEAMAQGVPVVSTYYSGIPELVEDGITGYLVPEKEIVTLAHKIGYLAKNSDLRCKMGTLGRKKVLNDYNIELLCDRLVYSYQQLIDNGNLETATSQRGYSYL